MDKQKSLLAHGAYNRLEDILKKRINGRPLQYLLGDTEFMGLIFKVRPGVLIPRPETEVLVAEVLACVKSATQEDVSLLDIGTGSGNIAVALAKFLTKANVCAVDIAPECLALAQVNAKLNRCSKRITFYASDLFSCFKKTQQPFDYIISNPPYVSPGEYKRLPDDVRQEPFLALVADDNGFYFYKKIEKQAFSYLKDGGKIFLEIGDEQACGIKEIFNDISKWQDVKFVKDLCGRDRVAVVTKISL
jgi:release factor glutamine methyltransferase